VKNHRNARDKTQKQREEIFVKLLILTKISRAVEIQEKMIDKSRSWYYDIDTQFFKNSYKKRWRIE